MNIWSDYASSVIPCEPVKPTIPTRDMPRMRRHKYYYRQYNRRTHMPKMRHRPAHYRAKHRPRVASIRPITKRKPSQSRGTSNTTHTRQRPKHQYKLAKQGRKRKSTRPRSKTKTLQTQKMAPEKQGLRQQKPQPLPSLIRDDNSSIQIENT